jgi:thiamine pyrophosphokinase
MIVKIFTNPVNYTLDTLYKKDEFEYLIGVEQGAYYAVKKGLTLDMALGDFDSITKEEYKVIEQHAKSLKKYPSKKDETDTFLAVEDAKSLKPERIIIYGGIGSRIDHTYANILLAKNHKITFINNQHKLYTLSKGTYTIDNPHRYISFFALEEVIGLTLEGFDYTLKDYTLTTNDPLSISNKGSGTITFNEGILLVIEAND